MSQKHPSGWEIVMGLLILLLLMASVGDGDYQEALEQENRALKARLGHPQTVATLGKAEVEVKP